VTIHDRSAFVKQRLGFAKRVIEWCPSVEWLGRWLIRVSRWLGVRNLPGYLRTACGHGDPGTVLSSHAKNRLGRAADRWRDFSTASERGLLGKYAVEVEKLFAGSALHASATDEGVRQELRAKVQLYLKQHRPAAARAVLLKLVGHDRSDLALQSAVEGILTLPQAKRLLGAVA
jgi:hypothetical protein